jgi:mono/diheme cytochrome c family protein
MFTLRLRVADGISCRGSTRAGAIFSLAAYLVTTFGTDPRVTDFAPAPPSTLERGRAALRAMDCARCHGKDYRGLAAPSLLAAVRESPREQFERIVLDGDVVRGMPPYRSQPVVAADLDAIYSYLRALADAAPGGEAR